jgi:hypothetical protein
MRTRAALIGARLHIAPNPAGRGTRVLVEVDLADSLQPPAPPVPLRERPHGDAITGGR